MECSLPVALSFAETFRIIGPWLLWTVANYGISALFDGEGSVRGVIRTNAFCLVPYIVFAVPIALLSHVLTGEERGLYEALWSIVYYWTLILLLLQIRTVHNYTGRKTLGVAGLMVFGVAVLGGTMALVWLLSTRVFGFLGEVVYELIQIVG